MEQRNKKAVVGYKAAHPGALVAHWLEEEGIKQKHLAEKMGIPQSRLSEFLHGKKNMTADMAAGLAEHLGMDADYWMRLQIQYEYDTRILSLDTPKNGLTTEHSADKLPHSHGTAKNPSSHSTAKNQPNLATLNSTSSQNTLPVAIGQDYAFEVNVYIFEEMGYQKAYCPSLNLSSMGNSFSDAIAGLYRKFQKYIEKSAASSSLEADLNTKGWKTSPDTIVLPDGESIMKDKTITELLCSSIPFRRVRIPMSFAL